MKKVSNTEQLAGTINKGIRIFGKVFTIYAILVVIALVGLIVYAFIR